MKNIYSCLFLFSLFITGCTATIYTVSEEQFRDNTLTAEAISRDGIALLPVTGSNQTFNSVVSIAADYVLNEYQFSNYAGVQQVSNDLNRQGLVRDYHEMINNYNSTGLIDNSQLKKVGEATGTRYLLKIEIGSLNRAADTESSYVDGSVYTSEEKDVRIYGLLWDADNGHVVWEAASTAVASEGEYTVINQSDGEFYQAATAELINKLHSSRS